MEFETILSLVTIVVTWFLGVMAKKSKFINNNLIPVQNVLIGVIIAIIEWVITKDFNVALSLSGLIAGGTYDIVHNLEKLIRR